jgi:hypothetical protein
MREAQSLGRVDTGPSPRIWHNCPWHAIQQGTRRGIAKHEDFENFPDLSTTAVTGLYASYAATGATIKGNLVDEFGVAELTVDADADQEAIIQSSGGIGTMIEFINPTTANPHEIWFEARYKLTAAVFAGNSFIGFQESVVPATGTVITTSGVMTDHDFFGFSTLEATPTILNLTYKEEGSTVQVPITTVATMATGTWINVGFHYNPLWPNGHKIAVYANNDKNATKVTKANMDAATFPKDVAMAFTAAIMNVTDIEAMTIDWYRVAMLEL